MGQFHQQAVGRVEGAVFTFALWVVAAVLLDSEGRCKVLQMIVRAAGLQRHPHLWERILAGADDMATIEFDGAKYVCLGRRLRVAASRRGQCEAIRVCPEEPCRQEPSPGCWPLQGGFTPARDASSPTAPRQMLRTRSESA